MVTKLFRMDSRQFYYQPHNVNSTKTKMSFWQSFHHWLHSAASDEKFVKITFSFHQNDNIPCLSEPGLRLLLADRAIVFNATCLI